MDTSTKIYMPVTDFFISIIKTPITAATYYCFHFVLPTVSYHCFTLYLTVSFCLHLLTRASITFFFFKSLLVHFAASVKFLSASKTFFSGCPCFYLFIKKTEIYF